MIKVELHEPPEGGGPGDYRATHWLTVHDDGTHEAEGPGWERIFEIPVPVVDLETGGPKRVFFDDDPTTWARNLSNSLRTGYLVPVTVKDDAAGAADE